MSIRKKELVAMSGTICFTLLILFLISKGNCNWGLWDDNQSQWLEIIDASYRKLFQTGHLPVIDWYQMKGMKIYDQGYYGLWNPFMALSFLVKEYLLSFLPTNTITVYIYIMCILGNLSCYGIFRKIGVRIRFAVLGSLFLLSASVYVFLGYWYYVYNVYFIVPFLLYLILKIKNEKKYYCHGAVLALSLLMGNVQYTVYMCIAYAVIMVYLSCSKDVKYLLSLLTNGVTALFFMSVYLVLLLQTAGRSLDFSNENNLLYGNAVHPILFALFSWIPSELTGGLAHNLGDIIKTTLPVPGTGVFPNIGFFYMGTGILYLFLFFIRRRRYRQDQNYHLACACICTAFIALLCSFEKIGILTIVMEQIPLLNSFRIMSKFLVLIPVLLLIPTAVVMKNEFHTQNKRAVLCGILTIVFFILGCMQNSRVNYGVPQADLSVAEVRLQELKVDYQNYRIAGFSSYEEISLILPDWKSFTEKEEININEKFSKNAGTQAGIFTLGGYDLAFEAKKYEQSNMLMQTPSGYASEFGYDNLIIEDYFFPSYNQQSGDYELRMELLKNQITQNSLKYFIFSKESLNIERFREMLWEMGFTIEWEEEFLEHTVLLSIKTIPSLVTDKQGRKVSLEADLDELYFTRKEEKLFHLSFTYDSHVKAVLQTQDGTIKELAVSSDEFQYMHVLVPEELGQGTIHITYENKFYSFAKIWTIFTILLILFFIYGPTLSIPAKYREILINCGTKLRQTFSDRKSDRVARFLFCMAGIFYVIWIGNKYIRISVTEPDEIWFMKIFNSINHLFLESPISVIGQTENYLGYGQLYWIVGGLINNMVLLRIMAFLCLIGSGVIVLRDAGYLYGKRFIPYAGVFLLSMPYFWYTHKIIGPELPALFLCVLGTHLFLTKSKYTACAWLILGAGVGLKLNYICFPIYLFLILISRFWKNKKALISSIGSGVGYLSLGYLVANPIVLLDIDNFIENGKITDMLDFASLSNVFGDRFVEWDGVMTNGLFYGYISWFLLIMLFFLCLTHRKSRTHKFILTTVFIIIIVMCCRSRFLGWYLLPLIYFLPHLFACSNGGIGTSGIGNILKKRVFLLMILIVNLLLLLPVHLQQRNLDIKHISMIQNKDKNIAWVEENKTSLEQHFQSVEQYYMLEFQYDEYSFWFHEYVEFCQNRKDGIAYIGNRMLSNPVIGQIVTDAKQELNGLSILNECDEIIIVMRKTQ